jgi:hypothetical protein
MYDIYDMIGNVLSSCVHGKWEKGAILGPSVASPRELVLLKMHELFAYSHHFLRDIVPIQRQQAPLVC